MILACAGDSLQRRLRALGPPLAVLLLAGACDGATGEVREWRPSDHQPPPAMPDEQARAEPKAPARGSAEPGLALWRTHCVPCHGVVGRGDGPAAPPGAQLPDMTQASWQQAATPEGIATVIREGRGLMPAFGDKLSDEGIQDLVRLIQKL